jgi:hypothetical protein
MARKGRAPPSQDAGRCEPQNFRWRGDERITADERIK